MIGLGDPTTEGTIGIRVELPYIGEILVLHYSTRSLPLEDPMMAETIISKDVSIIRHRVK